VSKSWHPVTDAGTKRIKYLEQNVAAFEISKTLTEQEIADLEAAVPKHEVLSSVSSLGFPSIPKCCTNAGNRLIQPVAVMMQSAVALRASRSQRATQQHLLQPLSTQSVS